MLEEGLVGRILVLQLGPGGRRREGIELVMSERAGAGAEAGRQKGRTADCVSNQCWLAGPVL